MNRKDGGGSGEGNVNPRVFPENPRVNRRFVSPRVVECLVRANEGSEGGLDRPELARIAPAEASGEHLHALE
jgi:hypothetical protein